MIEVQGLSKRHGSAMVVDDLTFRVLPGRVTGFLGPNGAGKSTAMRMILGLGTPTRGRALVAGRPYRAWPSPLRIVGSLLEPDGFHGGRTAASHLDYLAASNHVPRSRIGAVLEQTGLSAVGRQRVGGFSAGMRQRLGIAAALLGDPQVLLLDEPVNRLDPEGIAWIRNLLRAFASEGRTVFVSSHLMSEMAQTADHVILIGQGRLIADADIEDLLEPAPAEAAAQPSLEDAFLRLTEQAVRFRAEVAVDHPECAEGLDT